MTNSESQKWLTLESLLAQTLKMLVKLDLSVHQTLNFSKTTPDSLQQSGYEPHTIANNFKATFGLIKVMDIVVKDQLESLSSEQSLEDSSKSEDRFSKAQQNNNPLGFGKKTDTDFENFSMVNVNEEPKFDLEIDDSMVSNEVNHLLNSKINPVRQQVSEIQSQLRELKNDLEKTNQSSSNCFAQQLKNLQDEITKLKDEKVQVSETLNVATSSIAHLEKELKSIKEAKLQTQQESKIEKDSVVNKQSENRSENLKFEGTRLNGSSNLLPEMINYRKNLEEILPYSYEGSKKIEWLQLSSNLLFKAHTTAPSDKFGPNTIDACQNVILKLVKSGTLISGLKIEKLKSIGILDAECITLPFACCRNNKELFTRPVFAETHFIGLRFIYLKSFQKKLLAFEGDSSVDAKSADAIKPGQGEWVLESIGGNNVFLSHNSKEHKNVLAINDVGDVLLTSNRTLNYHEEFEMIYHSKERVVTLQRIRTPRYYLSCDENGKVNGYLHYNLLGNEGWKIE